MSTYIIGDVHGCYDELMALLGEIRFNRAHDRLIFVGDLINRGPRSVEVLRFIRGLGDNADMVLGNHDLSLLAYALGIYHGRGTDFSAIMKAQDSEKLIEWLRKRPLLIHDKDTDVMISHAGIPPRWSLTKAIKQAAKAEKKLRGNKFASYLKSAFEGKDAPWSDGFDKYDKFRYRINGLTRMRYCDEAGEPDYQDKCPLGQQGEALLPWFERRNMLQHDGKTKLVFGHWASLGYYTATNATCIDAGCAWGGKLTAIKIERNCPPSGFRCYQVKSKQKKG